MLELKKITDKQKAAALAEKYSLRPEGDLLAYIAENRGEMLGACFYRPTVEGMEIVFAETQGDIPLFDGLLRAAMAFLFDKENDAVVFGPDMDFDMLRAARFVKEDEDRIKSANVFFETCKKCKN